MRLVLPLPPNLGNKTWGHWAVKKKARDDYYTRCLLCYPKLPKATLARARITVTLYVWSKMDRDNLMARCKWPVDFLKARGFIVDDDDAHLEWSGLPRQEIDRKDQRVEILLEAA